MLGLREPDELDVELDKRDYGTWLHAVLHQFHTERRDGVEPSLSDEARLQRAAQTQMQVLALSAAEFLPFSASFARFVPAYLAWLGERAAERRVVGLERAGERQERGDLGRRRGRLV